LYFPQPRSLFAQTSETDIALHWPSDPVTQDARAPVLIHRHVNFVTSWITQCERIVRGDIATSYDKGLSNTLNAGMNGRIPWSWAATYSDFEHHDAQIAPLQNPILREDDFVVIATKTFRIMLLAFSFN
jgi:hypothetical protein